MTDLSTIAAAVEWARKARAAKSDAEAEYALSCLALELAKAAGLEPREVFQALRQPARVPLTVVDGGRT